MAVRQDEDMSGGCTGASSETGIEASVNREQDDISVSEETACQFKVRETGSRETGQNEASEQSRGSRQNGGYIRKAFIKSLPIMCSYLFLGTAYGIMMEEAGLPWYISLIISLIVYTGAFQFVLITFLSGGASIVSVVLTGLLMNSRQSFYALTFLDDFKAMGRKLPIMIHTLTDETFAVNCTLKPLPERERHAVMFWLAMFSWAYWNIGSVTGGLLGQIIPFDLEGIDFCMTALFTAIFVDQWESAKKAGNRHIPAISGLVIGCVCLMIFGKSSFMLPSLLIVSLVLVINDRRSRTERSSGQKSRAQEL